MYALGKGVEKDPVSAYAWAALAADNGLEAAAQNRSDLRELLTTDQFAQAVALKKRLRTSAQQQAKSFEGFVSAPSESLDTAKWFAPEEDN